MYSFECDTLHGVYSPVIFTGHRGALQSNLLAGHGRGQNQVLCVQEKCPPMGFRSFCGDVADFLDCKKTATSIWP